MGAVTARRQPLLLQRRNQGEGSFRGLHALPRETSRGNVENQRKEPFRGLYALPRETSRGNVQAQRKEPFRDFLRAHQLTPDSETPPHLYR